MLYTWPAASRPASCAKFTLPTSLDCRYPGVSSRPTITSRARYWYRLPCSSNAGSVSPEGPLELSPGEAMEYV